MAELKATSMTGYTVAFGGLLALTTLSFGLRYAGFPLWGSVTASIAIAILKSGIVAFVFMHLAEERASSRIALLVAILLLGFLLSLTAADVATR
ncbi:MAG TPA: cytochrome C oxidase subunit IV family protein [Planctomycetota bacterium]|nr:cytochrome C oxidase subunit IV family protein [Planctomycetota bacterium]